MFFRLLSLLPQYELCQVLGDNHRDSASLAAASGAIVGVIIVIALHSTPKRLLLARLAMRSRCFYLDRVVADVTCCDD